MKRITTLCLIACALASNNNNFGMLAKQTLRAQKYHRSVHSKEYYRRRYIKHILRNSHPQRPVIDNIDYNWKPQDMAQGIYFRNNTIIALLKENIRDIEQNIATLEKQQNSAVQSLHTHTKEIKELENQLRKSFKVKKLE